MAELDGAGFSYRESQMAIKIVANTLFGRNWKLPAEENSGGDEHESTFDTDTLPKNKINGQR